MNQPIQRLRASLPRRATSLAIHLALGGMLVWIAVTSATMPFAWRAILLGFGTGLVILAREGWCESAQALILTTEGLHQENGEVIAPFDLIASVDRGVFAFKPSNGFVLRLTRPVGFAWTPGMWWRVGRRVGVGGVTSGAGAKSMADTLAMMIVERDKQRPAG
ncbi:hypothetical protein [uncultured Jannaschia sp.]|uniref:hypothetical protein n=1 Tax=uncultured Jannaschia sp. TaxID=293347 RepID=UPI002635DAAB|nr:hypothetical protein [uncultured Jannaschia sp.]